MRSIIKKMIIIAIILALLTILSIISYNPVTELDTIHYS